MYITKRLEYVRRQRILDSTKRILVKVEKVRAKLIAQGASKRAIGL